jgi:hypothetical protein
MIFKINTKKGQRIKTINKINSIYNSDNKILKNKEDFINNYSKIKRKQGCIIQR